MSSPPDSADASSSDLSVVELRCDTMVDPLGVDSTPPRLSWKLHGTGRSERQSAWQILVASSAEALAANKADVWDSGRVDGDAQLFVSYGGRPLTSAEKVFWKVRIWDGHGNPSAWSVPATWTMGVTDPKEWKAQWITDPEFLHWTRPKLGFHSENTDQVETPKWVQLDLKEPRKISAIKLYALRHVVPEGTGFPERFKIESSDDPSFRSPKVIVDQTQVDYPVRWALQMEFPLRSVTARYLRLTSSRLKKTEGVACLGFSQIEVLSAGKNVAENAGVTASDSMEKDIWSAQSVVDGLGVPHGNPLANATLLARRQFPVTAGLRRATVFVSGLGHYELTINGTRVGTGLLTPGWTAYDKTRLYDTYDLTALLQAGANVAGVSLGNGMYNVQEGRYVKFTTPFRAQTALVQLRLEYADGHIETFGTDETWRITRSPITFSNIFGGEDYDAQLEPVGWTQPGFNDSAWTQAALMPAYTGILRGSSQSSPPFSTHEVLSPVTTKQLRAGVTVYDFGQNASAMPRLRVKGSAGSRVKMIPSELVKPDGSIDRSSCSPEGAESAWTYTLRGGGQAEDWFPKFFYHGGRYLQVELTAGKDGKLPVVETLQSVVVHSDSPSIGEFSCSNELFNRINTLIRWAQRSNLAHVITDCPHRERLGWLEQYHLNGPALRYGFDLTRLYAKSFQDIADSQLPNGLVPDIAPEYVAFGGGFRDSPEWGSTIILAAWQQYVWTGDDTSLRTHYEAMQRYLAYLTTRADDGIVSHGLGDWYDIGPKKPGVAQLTPIALTATAIYYECSRTLARIATQIGHPDDAKRYDLAADHIREAFNRKFFNAETGVYATGSQTSQAFPLVLGLVSPAQRDAALGVLVNDIQTRGNAITAGDVGYRYVLRALADEGRSDVVYAMNNQSDKPGYGYQLAQGCTSLAEAWNADRTSSQNHFMLGQIVEWFYGTLAGIAPDPTAPGFKRVIIHPQLVEGLEWARARYESPRGTVAVSWKKVKGAFLLRAEVPPNVSAELWIPVVKGQQVFESGEPATKRPGIRLERVQNGCSVFSVDSGHFDFAVLLE